MNKQENTEVKSKTSIRKAGTGVAFTEADLKFIEENISTMKLTEMGVHLNRKFGSIRHKVSKMGLSEKRIYTFVAFTPDEVAFLQENATKHTIKELVELTGRTYFSIEKKLRTLNIKAPNKAGFERMTEADIAFMKKNYEKLTNKQLAEKLNKNVATISKHLAKLGLRYPMPRDKKIS